MMIQLAVLLRVIRMKYNALRLHVINLISHHANCQTYCRDYELFLSHVRRSWPHLVSLAENNNNEPTLLIIGKRHYGKKLYQKPRFKRRYNKFIYGKKSYHKYVAVKKILKAILSYNEALNSYTRKIERSILHLIKLMNEFNKFYTKFIVISIKEYHDSSAGKNEQDHNNINDIFSDSETVYHLQNIYDNVSWQKLTL